MSAKVIVMGVGGVGKSAITSRFVAGRWVEKYNPTIEESFTTTVELEGKAIQVEILDTAGQDEYTPLRETFMHTGDGFLLVYSITDDQTYEEVRGIYQLILRVHRNKNVPIVLVGNKLDLAKKERAVSKEEGKALASEIKAQFVEVSAKDNTKVKEAFNLLLKLIMKDESAKGKQRGKVGNASGVFGSNKGDPIEEEESKPSSRKIARTLRSNERIKSSSERASMARGADNQRSVRKSVKSEAAGTMANDIRPHEKSKCLII